MAELKSLKEVLKSKLDDDEKEDIPTSFDVVGDIAVIKIPDSLVDKKHLIGESLLEVQGNVNTVLRQKSPVSGEFRTRDLEVIAGEDKTETTHKEYGCSFDVDLEEMYFSPRLAHERNRITEKIEDGEVVTNMFAGVGCYSILAAVNSDPEKVYSIDKNEKAVEYMEKNIRKNKVGDKVIPVRGDAREVIDEYLVGKSDRVLMPLPEFARDFIEPAFKTVKPEGGIIHFYDYGEEPEVFGPSFEFIKNLDIDRSVELKDKAIVRSYAPNLYHVVLDLLVE